MYCCSASTRTPNETHFIRRSCTREAERFSISADEIRYFEMLHGVFKWSFLWIISCKWGSLVISWIFRYFHAARLYDRHIFIVTSQNIFSHIQLAILITSQLSKLAIKTGFSLSLYLPWLCSCLSISPFLLSTFASGPLPMSILFYPSMFCLSHRFALDIYLSFTHGISLSVYLWLKIPSISSSRYLSLPVQLLSFFLTVFCCISMYLSNCYFFSLSLSLSLSLFLSLSTV